MIAVALRAERARPEGTPRSTRKVGPARLPLAVDLDGTLIRSDLFKDAILRFVLAAPLNLFKCVAWLLRGRAYAKAKLAQVAPADPATLPYDERVLEWLAAERATGRRIVLATAADHRAAQAVAHHLKLFDDVLASDGDVNLKSERKAWRLREAFPKGFVYAGNERTDLKVWEHAAGAVVINAPSSLVRRVEQRFAVEQVFPSERRTLAAIIKAIRVRQWAKNVLVFLPMFTAQGWANFDAWWQALLAFAGISLAASSVYLVNDAADIDADRQHVRKRKRPFASGALSPAFGVVFAVLLLTTGIALATAARVGYMVVGYVGLSTLYTFWLKRKLLVDVFVLASLYTVRVILGGVATGYLVSGWLLAFSCFFFLSLALVKRAAEIGVAAGSEGTGLSRRGYRSEDGAIIKTMGVAAGFMSSLVLALYLENPIILAHFTEPLLLWALPALVVFWLCRVWLLTDRGRMHDDPLVFASRDRVSWVVAGLTGATFVAAATMPPGLLPWI